MISTTRNKCKLLQNKLIKLILPLFAILTFWEVLYLITDNSYIVPGISETTIALFKIITAKGFLSIVLIAFLRVVAGLFLGVILGTLLATLCHYFEVFNTILTPFISIMKATPVACIIVLLWISMTYSQLTVFVVMLMVMPIVWQNVVDAFRSVDKDLCEVADIFEFTPIKRFRLLIFPTVLKYLVPAIITSIGLAWKAGVAAEIMTNNNMGRLIYNYKNVTYDTASIFAWTVIIVVLSLVFEKAAKHFLWRLTDESVDKES